MKGVADALLFAGKGPSEQPHEDSKSKHHHLHVQVEKNQWFQSLLLIIYMTEFINGLNLVTNVTDAGCVQC